MSDVLRWIAKACLDYCGFAAVSDCPRRHLSRQLELVDLELLGLEEALDQVLELEQAARGVLRLEQAAALLRLEQAAALLRLEQRLIAVASCAVVNNSAPHQFTK